VFTEKQKEALADKLHASHVKERTQAGRKLSYIEGWVAIAEANRIFGFDGWSSTVLESRCVAERERDLSSGGKGWSVSYIGRVRITIEADGQTIVREGIGAGHGIDRDLGLAHESAIKEMETDSRKRALMTFGNPFGLALYDKTQENVERGSPTPPSYQDREINIAPEGADFWMCAGAESLNANQAKKAGLDGVHERMREDILKLHTDEARREWIEANLSDIRKMPRDWRVILRADMEEQADMRTRAA
jgi:DNA recombination protein Rad52